MAAEGRGVVKRFQRPFLFPAARSGLNSAPAQDSRRRLCSRIVHHPNPRSKFHPPGTQPVHRVTKTLLHCYRRIMTSRRPHD